MSNLKVYAKTIEDEALEQINTLLSQDAFKDCKVRIMPDVHAGKGCVIGFTADLGNKVIPNIVGVDIGCGMLCVSLGHGVLMQICRTSLSASTIISTTTPTSSVKVLSPPSTEKRFLSPSICVTDVFSELAREMRIGTVLRRMELDGLCHG